MTATTFLGIALLLLAPGPTNAMLATAAASRGWRAVGPLLAPVGAAYVLSVATFGTLSAVVGTTAHVHTALKIACAALLTAMALRMWRGAGGLSATLVPPGRVFAATLANPKGFIIAVGLMPPPESGADMAAGAAAAALLAVAAAASWGVAGGLLRHLLGARLSVAPVERSGAVALAAFAALLTGSALV